MLGSVEGVPTVTIALVPSKKFVGTPSVSSIKPLGVPGRSPPFAFPTIKLILHYLIGLNIFLVHGSN